MPSRDEHRIQIRQSLPRISDSTARPNTRIRKRITHHRIRHSQRLCGPIGRGEIDRDRHAAAVAVKPEAATVHTRFGSVTEVILTDSGVLVVTDVVTFTAPTMLVVAPSAANKLIVIDSA